VPDVTIDYFCRIAKVLCEHAREMGYLTAIFDSGLNPAVESRIVLEVVKLRPAAVVLASAWPDADTRPDYLDLLERAGIPVVLFDRPLGAAPFPRVDQDHDDGARKCAGFIAEMGWRHAHILSGPRNNYVMRARVEAAIRELGRFGVDHTLHHGDLNQAAATRMAADIAAGNQPAEPRFLALNSTLALGAVSALVATGRALRDHLVSIDEVPLAASYGHPLCCVRYSSTLVAEQVFDLLRGGLTGAAAQTPGIVRVVPADAIAPA
jgi:DNA-binding LacI/PurR family transcriptional regulator